MIFNSPETFMASHLIEIGALTPRLTTNLDRTIRSVPDRTPEFDQVLRMVKADVTQDPWQQLEIVKKVVRPVVKYGHPVIRQIVAYMEKYGMWVNYFGGWNIVYLEGCDMSPVGICTPNRDELDGWNDVRLIFRFNGNSTEMHYWSATTEPGKFYTMNPLNSSGAARIAFGQYRAWVDGKHKGHDALIQRAKIILYRDLNKDGMRIGDKPVLCHNCGINQHTTLGNTSGKVGKWSAGCLVGTDPVGHASFLRHIRKDYRWYNWYEYITTVLDSTKI